MTKKCSLVLAPFFTNGDFPPLGLAYINAVLQEEGWESVCFDFCWWMYRFAPGEFHLLRQFFAVSQVKREVVFAQSPYLGLLLLFYDQFKFLFKRFSWQIEVKEAWVAFYLSLKSQLLPRWAEVILNSSPRVVFFSTYSSNYFLSLALAKEIKEREPHLPIIFGGPGSGVEELRELSLATGWVDGVVVGEGEGTVRELAQDLETTLKTGIKGLTLRKKDSLLFSPRFEFEDLDALPLPSFAGFPFPGFEYSAYRENRNGRYETHFFPISSNRGCINRCAFCSESAYWRKFRQRKLEKVLLELKIRNHHLGENRFFFNDSAFNANPRWVEDFCQRAEKELDFQSLFASYLIPSKKITPDFAQKLKQAGFYNVILGVETFSNSLRRRIYKRGSGDEVFQAILNLLRQGINVRVNLLVGFPGESEEEFKESLSYLERWLEISQKEHLPARLVWDAGHRLRVEAYSRFYLYPQKYGIKIYPETVPFPSSLSHLEKYFKRIFLRWQALPEDETIRRRSQEMKALARKANAGC